MSSPSYRSTNLLLRFGLLLLLVQPFGCDAQDDSASFPVVYEVQVADRETFRIAIDHPDLIREADSILAAGRVGVVHGHLASGDGGFNAPYHWHLRPESISFPDIAFEVCSGRPFSDVESDLSYWVDTIGIYCPWGARLMRRVTVRLPND